MTKHASHKIAKQYVSEVELPIKGDKNKNRINNSIPWRTHNSYGNFPGEILKIWKLEVEEKQVRGFENNVIKIIKSEKDKD